MRLLLCSGLILFASLTFATAQQATITAQSPENMADAMRDLGYRAQLTTDSDGDPLIRSAASGLKYGVYFYGCENGKACTTVQFYLGLELKSKTTENRMNEWNRTRRFGVAVLDDEGQPYLKMDLNLDFGGITTPAFEDNLLLWDKLISDFSDFTGFENAPAPREKAAPDVGPLKDL